MTYAEAVQCLYDLRMFGLKLGLENTRKLAALVEIVELPAHPFYIASQFHPEFLSKPNRPHPLFKGFIAAAHQRQHHQPLAVA